MAMGRSQSRQCELFTAALTKRKFRVLKGGIMTFGNEKLPVPLFGADGWGRRAVLWSRNAGTKAEEDCVKTQPRVVFASGATPEAAPLGVFESRQEGTSYTKVSRGDRTPVELFLAGLADWSTAAINGAAGM